MLGLYKRFEKGQFVQEISFKHEGLPRKDLGIEKFGYIQSQAIIARNYQEYNIMYAGQTENEKSYSTLDYCLRACSETEVLEKLNYIANHQSDFLHFIVSLNNCADLSAYHINEQEVVKVFRKRLSNLNVTVYPGLAVEITAETDDSTINNTWVTH